MLWTSNNVNTTPINFWPLAWKSNSSVLANGYHYVRFSWTAGLSCLSWKLLTTMWALWLPGVFRCPDTFRSLSGSTHPGGHCPSTLWESERSRESRGWEVRGERGGGDCINEAAWFHPANKANRGCHLTVGGEVFTQWGSLQRSWSKSTLLWKRVCLSFMSLL